MGTMDDWRREAAFVDVVTSTCEDEQTLYRFPNDKIGHSRAVGYRNAYNAVLRKAMGITDADLALSHPDRARPHEYDRAMLAETYRDASAGLSYIHPPKLVGNDDPMPTDYPHDF